MMEDLHSKLVSKKFLGLGRKPVARLTRDRRRSGKLRMMRSSQRNLKKNWRACGHPIMTHEPHASIKPTNLLKLEQRRLNLASMSLLLS